jgi:hypothetical protein
MSHFSKAAHTAYGAFELKAKYQLHMLYSTLITAATVALTILAVQIFATEAASPPPTQSEDDIITIKDIPPPPTVVWDKPRNSGEEDHIKPGVGIPEPVADELIVDDDVTIATRDELALLNGPDIGDGEGKLPVIMDLPEEMLPNIDSFIPV